MLTPRLLAHMEPRPVLQWLKCVPALGSIQVTVPGVGSWWVIGWWGWWEAQIKQYDREFNRA